MESYGGTVVVVYNVPLDLARSIGDSDLGSVDSARAPRRPPPFFYFFLFFLQKVETRYHGFSQSAGMHYPSR